MAIFVAGILVAITVAAFGWMKQNSQKPPGPADKMILAKAPSPATTINPDTKSSPNASPARSSDRLPGSTSVEAIRKEVSPSPVAPPTAQPGSRADAPVEDKGPHAGSESGVAKSSAPVSKEKPKTDVPNAVSRPEDVSRGKSAAKPVSPDEPKPDVKAKPPDASQPPVPAASDSATNPMTEPVLVAGNQYVAPDPVRFSSIDKHALAAPSEAEQSITALTAYLIKPARDDLEKVRAIYRWLTDRITYDVDDFFGGRPGVCDPEAVLKQRVAVCEGYSRLFKSMCDDARIEAVLIKGLDKGWGYTPGKVMGDAPTHTWNAVKLGGAWYLLDVTWATGSLKNKDFVKKLNEFYYLTRPDQFVFKHLPADPRWQLLGDPLTREQWQALPMVNEFLFTAGVSSQDIMKTAQRKTFRGLVNSWHTFGLPFVIHQAPLDLHMVAGSTLSVRFEAPQFLKMAIDNEGKLHFLTKEGNFFTGSAKLQKGIAKVKAQYPGKGGGLTDVLEYVVDEKGMAAPAPAPDVARGDDLSITLDSLKIDSVVAGPMVNDADLKGKVVLMEFWGFN
jgi:Transglutaminase-like superfamily